MTRQTAYPAIASIGPSFPPVERVARKLIGTLLLFDGVGGVIVETEPYDHEDPASHNARGRTTRNRTMFGPPGHAYVYRSYGLHWCLKFVCGVTAGSAVLVRAIRPVTGLDAMRVRRGDVPEIKLCAGLGRFCAALGIDAHWDGHDLMQPLRAPGGPGDGEIQEGPRIGMSRAEPSI